MLYYRYLVLLFLACFIINSWSITADLHQFTVYGYVPWKTKIGSFPARAGNELSDVFLSKGIKPIHVIYENKYCSNGTIDLNKIKNIALKTSLEPNIPVSFDIEFGNRFKPATVVPYVKTILKTFRRYNSKSLLGVYALIPQNTYGLKINTLTYNRFNSKYDSLVNAVDFFSPSLYNYNGHDFNSWFNNARFVISHAKQYKPAKPIIPYVSPIVRLGPSHHAKNGNLVEELSEQEMSQRLHALYDLGASGCIIWASSQDRTRDGQFPKFNPNKGWGKAVVAFIASTR